MMKEEFPEYFRPSEEEFKVLWSDAFIVFDANVLLNLYLLSSATRGSVLLDLRRLKDRLWIPAQVGEEYLRNRVSKIEQQHEIYQKMYRWLSDITANFELMLSNVSKHPTLNKDPIQQSLKKTFKRIEKIIKDQESIHKSEFIQDIDNDDVLAQLSELYAGRIGRRWNRAELVEAYKEGEERYRQKVPPGYKDANKDKRRSAKATEGNDGGVENSTADDSSDRKYGDFILWKQILEWSKAHDKPVIFVTEDAKEDWWLRDYIGRSVGPRPELIAEHGRETAKPFYMYRPEIFWKYAHQELNSATGNDDSIADIERVTRANESPSYKLNADNYYKALRNFSAHSLGRIDPSLLNFGKIDPSLLNFGKFDPSLLNFGKFDPSLLNFGKIDPSLLDWWHTDDSEDGEESDRRDEFGSDIDNDPDEEDPN